MRVFWALAAVGCAETIPGGDDGSIPAPTTDPALSPPLSTGATTPATSTGASTPCALVRVVDTGGGSLNVRPDPSTQAEPVGALPEGAEVAVLDIVAGEVVDGVDTWYEIEDGALTGFVSGRYAACVEPTAPTDEAFPPDVFLLPLTCGATVEVTQGNQSPFSHTGDSAYAFDFGLPNDTPLLAMKAGVVVYADDSTQPGDPCYAGGGPKCIDEANYVTLDHGDGTNTIYAHVNAVDVAVGDRVERGALVAWSGGTGYSTGPHAHVAAQDDCGRSFCPSIPMQFGDVPGDGVPETGDQVTSQNDCP